MQLSTFFKSLSRQSYAILFLTGLLRQFWETLFCFRNKLNRLLHHPCMSVGFRFRKKKVFVKNYFYQFLVFHLKRHKTKLFFSQRIHCFKKYFFLHFNIIFHIQFLFSFQKREKKKFSLEISVLISMILLVVTMSKDLQWNSL